MTNIELNSRSIGIALRMARWGQALGLGLAAACLGCGNGVDAASRPACLSGLNADSCDLAYPPQFDLIFDRILKPSCASAGVSCHGSEGGQGGLTFVDATDSYDRLLAPKPGGARVEPGDAACSEIVVRLDSIGSSWSMPPTSPLDERERCTIRRWIQAGAARTP